MSEDAMGHQEMSGDIRGCQGRSGDNRGYQGISVGYLGIPGDTEGHLGISGDTMGFLGSISHLGLVFLALLFPKLLYLPQLKQLWDGQISSGLCQGH